MKRILQFVAVCLLTSAISPQGTGGKGTGMTFTVKFHPTYNNTLFCSGWGGLWISTDNGAYWQNFHTDKGLPQCAVIDVVIHPTNNMIFVATGDGDGDGNLSYAPSIGIWRFTYGGTSDNWENISSGLPTFVADPDNFYYMRTLAMHPTNPDIILVATSVGIFKTINATDPEPNWLELKNDPDISGKYFRTILFKPGNPNTIYASGKEVFRSTDGGATWDNLNLSVPTIAGESVYRINIAVTPAAPSLLYAYIFTDGGANSYYFQKYNGTVWENKTKVPVVHDKNRGLMALTVSPTNANEIYVGNTVIFRSLKGGGSWEQISDYNGAIHADIHDLRLRTETRSGSSVNILYAAGDGGMFRTTVDAGTSNTSSWETINKGLSVGTIFRMGGDARNPGRMLIGEQEQR